MNINRLWAFGAVVVIVALVAGGWFIGISPKLDEATAANTQRATVEGTNTTHAATLVALEAQFDRIDDLKRELKALQVAIPSDADLDSFLDQLKDKAASNGVVILSVAVSDPRPFAPEEAGALAELEIPEILAAQSSVTTDNFLSIPMQISIKGTYAKSLAFISALQGGGRLFLAFNVSLDEGEVASGGDRFGTVEMVVEGQAYVLRPPSDVAASAPTEGEPALEAGASEASEEAQQ